ncbi:hypothetical protein CBM2626_B120199 [Cupriavidus taiwanensis]|uniref:Uncharacterized protein n=1 Tax=Cupriavidus taiwanensis TaxID=164546 RepID=A0A375EAY7_9BURK|nr:hypothetical protein CBM2614_B160080 [Cupriavidus taiwanensis]SOZ65072.1 hypothetical protein CBM2615_B150077 [Cupriavidus taiwanensis]SOZ68771.1 hypothetical protein CBM2613_B120077 [Cupriavidus taiwanensis]SPA01584.1 hypothetical protein CBM2626_B120199 [Cupriavidus taiwanensis]SPA08185.1 hypothetical protein CBM2625_B120075 [Cupriavidus taiwanensis]
MERAERLPANGLKSGEVRDRAGPPHLSRGVGRRRKLWQAVACYKPMSSLMTGASGGSVRSASMP